MAVVMATDHAEPRKEAELATIAMGTVLMTPGMPLAAMIGKIGGRVSPTTTFQLPGMMFSGGRATEDGVTGGALTVSVAAADAGAGGVVGLAAANVLPHSPQKRAAGLRGAPHSGQKRWFTLFAPKETLKYLSPRRMPGSSLLNFLDSGVRRNDKSAINQHLSNIVFRSSHRIWPPVFSVRRSRGRILLAVGSQTARNVGRNGHPP